MKKISLPIIVCFLSFLAAQSLEAQNVDITIEPDAANNELDVYLTANGASYTSEIFNELIFTLRWPSGANFNMGAYTPIPFDFPAGLAWNVSAPVAKQGAEVTNSGSEYQTFGFAANTQTFNPFGTTNTTLDDGVKTLIGSIDITGYSAAGLDVCSFKYTNDTYTGNNNANLSIKIAGANVTGSTASRTGLTSTYTGSWDNCDFANLESVDNAVISSGTYTMTADATVNNLDINPGAALNAGSFTVTASGTFTCNADNTGYGQYLGSAVPLVFEQYVGNSGGWCHLGIPVSGNIGTILSLGGAPMNYSTAPSNQQNLFTFNTTTFAWDAVANAGTDIGLNGLVTFTGGTYFPVTNGLISFTGTSKDGAQSITYNFASSPVGDVNFDGWNLFANPYSCNIDFNTLDDQDGNVFSSYSVWDAQNMVYQSWNGTVGTNGGQQYIAPGQAFWIKSVGGNGTSFDFAETDRTLSGGNVFVGTFKTTAASVPVIRLSASTSSGGTDEAVIYFPTGSTPAFDQSSGDAFKPWNTGSTNIFTHPLGSGENLAINAYGNFDPAAVIPVGFAGDTTSGITHTIALDVTALDPAWETVYLEDLVLNQKHDLNSGPYTFAPSPLAPLHRFNVSFANSTIGLDDPTPASDIYAYTKGEMIYVAFVNATPIQADVRLYDAAGQLVHEGTGISTTSPYSIPSHKLSKGLYVIRVVTQNEIREPLRVIVR